MVHIGRKAKPIHLHLLEGNTKRLTKDEIEQRLKAEKQLQAKKDKVKPPTWLDS
ncbi:terminase, partial [Bacillus thuringiensis]|nr:terminase [Bacillus thuringiensis]